MIGFIKSFFVEYNPFKQFRQRVICPLGHNQMQWKFTDQSPIYQGQHLTLTKNVICNQCQNKFSTILQCSKCKYKICGVCSKQLILHDDICQSIEPWFINVCKRTVYQVPPLYNSFSEKCQIKQRCQNKLPYNKAIKQKKYQYGKQSQVGKFISNINIYVQLLQCFYCSKQTLSFLFCKKCQFICCDSCRQKTKQFVLPFQAKEKIIKEKLYKPDELREYQNSKMEIKKQKQITNPCCPFNHKKNIKFLSKKAFCNSCSKQSFCKPTCQYCQFALCSKCQYLTHSQICDKSDQFQFKNLDRESLICYYCQQQTKSGISCKSCLLFICDKCRNTKNWK